LISRVFAILLKDASRVSNQHDDGLGCGVLAALAA
jgi:hypothetical protein